MKTIYLTIFSLTISTVSLAQETIEVNQKLTKTITAVYHVLKAKPEIKQGLYQVRHDKTVALASGLYANDKRVGIWHFFDYKGTINQNFDYDHNKLTYEAPDDQAPDFTYLFDKKLADTDVVTKPIKIGGRYLGYLPYLQVFKRPTDLNYDSAPYIRVTIVLLISPGGHLADFTIHLSDLNFQRDLSVNIDLMADEDKTFIPATLNREPVSARITIPCAIDKNWNLVFADKF